jgi:23S rRNA (cytosine1962-C5)-methyltransferase
MIDPPKFGRGTKGEVWKLESSLADLLDACRTVLSDAPLFVILNSYAIRASAVSLLYSLEEMVEGRRGQCTAGELAVPQRDSGRLLSLALFARWSSGAPSTT